MNRVVSLTLSVLMVAVLWAMVSEDADACHGKRAARRAARAGCHAMVMYAEPAAVGCHAGYQAAPSCSSGPVEVAPVEGAPPQSYQAAPLPPGHVYYGYVVPPRSGWYLGKLAGRAVCGRGGCR